MNKLMESFKKLGTKFKAMSKGAKIALIGSLLSIVIAIIVFGVYSTNNKYKVLFSDLDAEDAQVVTSKLKESKVDMKISGNSILVPTDQVDQLRLELAPEISNGSKGYELMDAGNSFGMTEEEFQIKKQRMEQGEIEKTIKSFPQVENARVHITPPKDSVFVKDKEPGKAAVYLALKSGQKLSDDQVRAIVALVSGSTDSIPRENIEVVDNKMNLLTKGLFDEQGETASSASVEKQQNLQKEYETKLEKSINDLLVPLVGKDKVKAKVNATLDFDSTQKTQVVLDPNKVIKNQETSKTTNSNSGGATSQSPVDNNMSNTISNGNSSVQSTSEQDKTEYEVGKTETKVISAPGEVKRVTASVIVDGNLDTATSDSIKNIVASAIGYKQDRGDEINVLGMAFDTTDKAEAQKEIDKMNQDAANAQKTQLIKVVAAAVVALIILAVIVAVIIKRRKPKEEEREHVLDVVIKDNIMPKEIQKFDPIDFETNNEKTHIENEIKKYASEKPEQVADIIKSWLTENERG